MRHRHVIFYKAPNQSTIAIAGIEMVRRKLHFRNSSLRDFASPDGAPTTASDYRIYPTYRRTATGTFTGDLKVVRTTDDRVIFPYDGAPMIGPFETALEAREAAARKGAELVAADLLNPEP
ncbi:hypothetical protein AC233_23080 [Burkholderia sp. HB1]|jgi:hypothetical protein|uniref:Uncharacterized protein n=2 Tax=Paraburkholderia graminis TaxID=60548 RepID=B1G091_PARG4|nr:hypothetical protein AC233_23080 [Burkholderia sp. HB1]EDT10670.1 hypothetical protein BgramDRAFT_2820 [Paraburkholderia graminis C4D1M]